MPDQVAAMRYRIKGSKVYVPAIRSEIVRSAGLNTGYDAGGYVSPRTSNWVAPSSGPNSLLGAALPTLRARSRDKIRRDGLADNAKRTTVVNFVGTGITPQFRTKDKDLNRELVDLFEDWSAECDSYGRQDFYGLQATAVGSMFEGGDCFTRFRVRALDDGFVVPLQLQVVESEFVPNEKNEWVGPNSIIRQGIEFDRLDRRVAYHMYRQHPFDFGMLGFAFSADTVRVPASEVLQLSQVRRPGEIRGEPWLTRALMKLHDLDKYDDAQLVKQQIGALFTGFVRGGPQTGNENEILSGQGDANEDGVAIASLEPGLMNLLRADQEITFSDPPKLEDSYESFMEGQERRVAVAAGILFEQLSGNYKHVNDRTWRAAVNEFRRAVEMYQHGLVVFQWAAPVLRRWAETAWLAGKIRLRNGVTLRDVVRVKWAPQAWPYINPTQDVAARRDEVRAGFLSRATHVSERGYAVQTVDEEIAEDNRRADELGLVLDSDPRKVTVAGVAQQPKKDVVDDKPSD